MDNVKKTVANKAVQSPQAATQSQHSSDMSPLYPNKPGFRPSAEVVVGGVILGNEQLIYNEGRPVQRLTIRNTGDRPIQVGSHFHLFEVNRYLEFDRDAAFGCHLNIPATTAIRFEPGDSREVEAVPFAGKRRVIGFNRLVNGYTGVEDAPSYYPTHMRAFHRMRHAGFKTTSAKQECNHKEKNQ